MKRLTVVRSHFCWSVLALLRFTYHSDLKRRFEVADTLKLAGWGIQT